MGEDYSAQWRSVRRRAYAKMALGFALAVFGLFKLCSWAARGLINLLFVNDAVAVETGVWQWATIMGAIAGLLLGYVGVSELRCPKCRAHLSRYLSGRYVMRHMKHCPWCETKLND